MEIKVFKKRGKKMTKTKIVFKKLTVKESGKILGGTSDFSSDCAENPNKEDCTNPEYVCDLPVEPDCNNYKPDLACTVNVETDCK